MGPQPLAIIVYSLYLQKKLSIPKHTVLKLNVSVAHLVASMSGVVLGRVVEVVGSNLPRGKIFTASYGSVDLQLSLCIYLLCKSASVSDPV